MVLQDKWDKKASRARVRKFKAKGRDLPENERKAKVELAAVASKGRPGKGLIEEEEEEDDDDDEDSSSDEDEDGKKKKEEFPTLPGVATTSTAAGKDKDKNEAEAKDKYYDKPASKFSKRKIKTNAWRYEDEVLDPNLPVEEPEPEPDYVALTLDRKGALPLVVPNAPEVDHKFLEESRVLQRRPKATEEWEATAKDRKSHVVVVDRKEFIEVEEKIQQRQNVDAFKSRFAATGRGKRAPAMSKNGCVKEDVEVDDVDAFLAGVEGIDLGAGKRDEKATQAWGKKGGSRVKAGGGDGDGRGGAGEDEWLDGLLSR